MKIQCVRIIKFDAGHRVMNHESKCRTLHGHEYKAEIFCEAEKLDELGRVIDFSVIKNIFGKWIDDELDHTMILCDQDPNLHFVKQCDGFKQPHVVAFNPTAENLAEYLVKIGNHLLNIHNVTVTKIKLWETSNCYVEVTNE